jgi:ABC-type bacteriocin/lantibiotic exporter with double-glycine peptidase domain
MKNLFTFFKGKYLINIEKSISIKMNNDLIVKVFNLPYYFFKSKSTGEVMSRINDFKSFKNILIDLISNTFINVILVVISMIVLLVISYKLFLINMIGIVLYFLIILMYRNIFLRKTENILVSEGNYNKLLHESICGYETNKNINMINDSIKSIEIGNIKYSNSIYSYENSLNNQIILKEIVMNSIYIISIFLGIKYINNGTLTLGEFTLFNSVIYYFSDPIKEILDLEPNINYIKNIYNRINDLLIMKNNNENDVCIDNIKGDIIIDNLSYSHDGIKNTFSNVNMNIKYGSKYLIYGNSGIGKSTIMKIILKYLNDYKGDIYIGNINLKDINNETISNNMTYVSQKSFIFNDTLKNNIICDRDINMNDYEKVINICNLINFRNNKALRNNFLIEDDGFNISGGERQKIILARSLLKESNYIILDEALSEVGILEEKEIINKIFKHYKDKTIIYISHKPEIINMFDQKFKLERRLG